MTNGVVTINGALALPTLLGQGPVRIPTGGKIRAGVKVLARKAAEHPKAKEIYERGVAANHSFDAIERAISEAVPELKTPLVPKNVPWFTVRPDDFPNAEIAKEILTACSEDRGDGAKLYRFPVVFLAGMWQAVMPHELVAWGANEKKFWIEYTPDGRVRYCKCYAPVPMDSRLRPRNHAAGCQGLRSRMWGLPSRGSRALRASNSATPDDFVTNPRRSG